ncbi:MAG: type II secretion system protein GspG [Candidatus Wallbacteria bacterium HGW-Wallbacteria-1]|uniref:Type II secretion system core protein G n=1 Tax=Candidatus Wallbacteria bacterium HGW-Wallbacteria-1 TaxID=2013854 RepID=A0A2N1PQN8_9BACT|nr:MAG: type II secretion system protein GspG [Candidatus Wallbacteria bacterium HGW-Wallbacteria-1]
MKSEKSAITAPIVKIDFTSSNRGFTLIEMLVVVVIMGILSTLVLPSVMGRTEDARTASAKTQIAMITLALDLYMADNGTYPTTDQGLEALIRKSPLSPVPRSWRGPYFRDGNLPMDPWGKEYFYISPGQQGRPFDLKTLGADGSQGGTGHNMDIESWKISGTSSK